MLSPITAECLAERSTRGPRYTSYPPATEFRPIDDTRVVDELDRIGRSHEPVSLYMHVPFCRSLCAYCGCNVIPTRDFSRGDRYVETVTTELAILAARLGGPVAVSELALGGGSPNFLGPPALRRLVTATRRYFAMQADARMSIELDPRSTTRSHVEAMAAVGFRSLSVGVQDFSPSVQNAIRRQQSVAQTNWLIETAREAGFDDINIDIVYGLPHQTEESFATTLGHVVAMSPDRIALFGYAHLPDALPHQRLVERHGRVLDSYERATLLLQAIAHLDAAGYVHLGLDHFARPESPLARAASEGRMRRTFQGYVPHRTDTILGVGTSAISSTRTMLWQNHVDLPAWERAIDAGQLPVQRGVSLDADDRIRRALIERLMCDGNVDLAAVGREHDIDAARYFAAELAGLSSLGDLASYSTSTNLLSTTNLGRLLVRNVCMLFDRYTTNLPRRFSSTI